MRPLSGWRSAPSTHFWRSVFPSSGTPYNSRRWPTSSIAGFSAILRCSSSISSLWNSDDLAALDVDQVVVMLVRRFFIARAAVAEIVLGENAGLLEQSHRAIDRGDGDVRIDRGRAPMHRLDIGMVVRLPDSTRAITRRWSGHLETALGAQQLRAWTCDQACDEQPTPAGGRGIVGGDDHPVPTRPSTSPARSVP